MRYICKLFLRKKIRIFLNFKNFLFPRLFRVQKKDFSTLRKALSFFIPLYIVYIYRLRLFEQHFVRDESNKLAVRRFIRADVRPNA